MFASIREISFRAFIAQMLGEFTRRDPAFVSHYRFRLESIDNYCERYINLYNNLNLTSDDLPLLIKYGLDQLNRHGLLTEFGKHIESPDPLVLTTMDSIVDAFLASENRLGLRLQSEERYQTKEDIFSLYLLKKTANGTRYLVRNAEGPSLVLVNAVGVPMSVWMRFMMDDAHDFKIVLVENSDTDLFEGGVSSVISVAAAADEIAEVLETEHISDACAIGWCSGGRIAIDLAARYSEYISKLVMVSPTLRGTPQVNAQSSPFEDTMAIIYAAVIADPALSIPMSGTMSQLLPSATRRSVIPDDVQARGDALLSMPAAQHAQDLLTPISNPSSLIELGKKLTADEKYPVHSSLGILKCPVLVITGDYDRTINGTFTLSALRMWTKQLIHAQVTGAGHYIFDVQYPYFLMLVRGLLSGGLMNICGARVGVETHMR